MLTVKTYLAPSRIHGIGLFAEEDIWPGTVVWRYNAFIDNKLPRERFLQLCKEVDDCTLKHLLHSSYKRNDQYFYLTDNARFINHSEHNCNIAFVDDSMEIAIERIRAHEELLENYFVSYDLNDFFFLEVQPSFNQDSYLNFIEEKRALHA